MAASKQVSPQAAGDRLEEAWVRSSVHCRRCAYDLRGLSAASRCPECGLEIRATLLDLIDPAASRMPQLRNPRGVGNALCWLALTGLLALLALAGHGLLMRMGVRGPGGEGWPVLAARLPHDLPLLAAALFLAGLYSALKFHPPPRAERDPAVRVDVWLLGAASLALGLLSVALWRQERIWLMQMLGAVDADVIERRAWLHLAMALAAAAGWAGLRGILQTIGRRSRAYRRARGGRQGTQPMLAATLGIAAGSLLRIIGIRADFEPLLGIATAVVWVCLFMLLIGMAYLLVNAWWIRQALRHPPPRLESLIELPTGA